MSDSTVHSPEGTKKNNTCAQGQRQDQDTAKFTRRTDMKGEEENKKPKILVRQAQTVDPESCGPKVEC